MRTPRICVNCSCFRRIDPKEHVNALGICRAPHYTEREKKLFTTFTISFLLDKLYRKDCKLFEIREKTEIEGFYE